MKLFTRLPHPTWRYAETKERILSIPDSRLRILCEIMYSTGGRLNEVLSIRPENINRIEEGKLVHIIMQTLKRKKQVYRDIYLEVKEEPEYCKALLLFKINATAEGRKTLEEWLGYKERKVERQIKKNLNCIPHSLRHLRATHLGKNTVPGKIHQSSPSYLLNYFGWTKISMASYYIDRLTGSDILDRYHELTSSKPANSSLESNSSLVETAPAPPSLEGGDGDNATGGA